MSSDTPSLRFTLGEQPGLPSIEATSSDDPAAMELLVPILPPEGVVAVKLSDVAARAATMVTGKLDVSGVRGGAAAAVVSALVRTGRRIVVVTEGAEEARRAAQDIGFLAEKGALAARPEGDEEASGDILVLTASESSPYAEVNPDRRGEMARLATLSHLALGRPWRVLVVSALALCRKTAPPAVVADRTERIVAESELDRDALVRRLSESGYLRVPVVEDPGSFAVRGALLDVWPPSSESPVRVELYGDLVLSLKPFTAEEQRTKKGEGAGGLTSLLLPPVREAVLDPKAVARAKGKVAELADAIDLPTRKARALSDDVAEGRTFFGAEGLLPAYYEELATFFDFIPGDALFVFDDPPPVTRVVRNELERANTDVLGKSHDVHFPPDAFFLSEEGIT